MSTKDDILKTLNWLKARIDNKDDGLPPGSMVPFAGTNVPKGYLLCNGAAVSRTTYAKLFAAIGTKWGAGDGSTTFNLPNSHRRFFEGTTSAGEVGQYVEAGLPNITGGFEFGTHHFVGVSATSGAFSSGTRYNTGYTYGAVDHGDNRSVSLNLGRNNGIFGKSQTIQPLSGRSFYLIKI